MDIKKYNEFNESINLTEEEKNFLWMKMEIRKRKKCEDEKNDIYKMLKGNETVSEEDLKKILNSLEYTMKKRIKDENAKAPKGKYQKAFNSLKSKLPSDWFGVKYSVLKRK